MKVFSLSGKKAQSQAGGVNRQASTISGAGLENRRQAAEGASAPSALYSAAVLLQARRIVAGGATGVGIRYRHSLIGFYAFNVLVILPGHGKEMGGDIVHPVIFPVHFEPFAETGS